MDKKIETKKQKPNWKFWLLLIAMLIFVSLLALTFCFYGVALWLNTILFPSVLGATASALVALYFTIKSDKERLFDLLSREIDSIFEKTMKLQEELYTVSYFPFYSGSLKKTMLVRTFTTKPNMYGVGRHYSELAKLYRKNTGQIIKEINEIPDNEYEQHFKEKSVGWGLLIVEIVDCALRTQEQFLQDFKLKPKGPIENQIIHRISESKNTEENDAKK